MLCGAVIHAKHTCAHAQFTPRQYNKTATHKTATHKIRNSQIKLFFRMNSDNTITDRSPQHSRITLTRLSEPRESGGNLAREVTAGLLASPRRFPTKYLYQGEGAALFEAFARQPHYYLHHLETDILRRTAGDIMRLVCPGEMIELGSGASTKTRLLLEAMHETGRCCRYVPLEISEATLKLAAEQLTADYSWLTVHGYVGDFDTDIGKLPRRNGIRRLVVFLGNTVGNFTTRGERVAFLGKLSAALIAGDALLLGVDLLKDVEDIVAGYQDPDGIGEKFLRRSLHVLKTELGAHVSSDHFQTRILWNPRSLALEMRLVVERETNLSIPDLDLEVEFGESDFVQLAVSTKFTREMITDDLREVGLNVSGWYTDSLEQYALVVATPHS